ncbi:MAG TPA: dTDP-4-dehydrorhamnose reductase [Bryobacteraceae bacterium]|jgi:dTDP-4-dehydrorhamnose reductase|nr:dTDP-4-dehydrorhamnose reductase [Bryobacteraceae bacterium]
MSKRAIVFGSSGQLGVELVRELNTRGYQVRGFERKAIDITDRQQVETCIADLDPKLVLNAAAYNQVDVAEREPQAAFLANALGVRNLAMACRQADARMVHFSTDYVFDGAAGRPYTEEDQTHPLGAYAVSKLAGELYAQAYLDDPLIVRTSGVFGPGGLKTARGNFIELMLRLACAPSAHPIRVVEDHVASPAYAPVLAARTLDLVERECSGIFHIGGGTPISWFEYAKLIFECAGLHPELQPTNEREYRTAARRPKYSALSNAKMESQGVAPFPPLPVAVKSYLRLRM